jgi:hypothetical protein
MAYVLYVSPAIKYIHTEIKMSIEIDSDVVYDLFDALCFPLLYESVAELLEDEYGSGFSPLQKLSVIDGLIAAGAWFFSPDETAQLRNLRASFVEENEL